MDAHWVINVYIALSTPVMPILASYWWCPPIVARGFAITIPLSSASSRPLVYSIARSVETRPGKSLSFVYLLSNPGKVSPCRSNRCVYTVVLAGICIDCRNEAESLIGNIEGRRYREE